MNQAEMKAELEKLKRENERLKEQQEVEANREEYEKYPITGRAPEMTPELKEKYRQANQRQRIIDTNLYSTEADDTLAIIAKINAIKEENKKLSKKRG